jgi:hypothetical protein
MRKPTIVLEEKTWLRPGFLKKVAVVLLLPPSAKERIRTSAGLLVYRPVTVMRAQRISLAYETIITFYIYFVK